jgi:carbon-monoxide dehydrogenase small subunit
VTVRKKITSTVNGQMWTMEVEPNETLLDILRIQMGIKSPKVGCERGDCGACTILLEGRTVRSCLILAVEADGCEITTVEGLCQDELTPLQRAFLEHNSFQCGFCAPGMVLAATELLGKNPHPTEEQIKEAISGNLCRCTGYQPIIDAVLQVSERKRRS